MRSCGCGIMTASAVGRHGEVIHPVEDAFEMRSPGFGTSMLG